MSLPPGSVPPATLRGFSIRPRAATCPETTGVHHAPTPPGSLPPPLRPREEPGPAHVASRSPGRLSHTPAPVPSHCPVLPCSHLRLSLFYRFMHSAPLSGPGLQAWGCAQRTRGSGGRGVRRAPATGPWKPDVTRTLQPIRNGARGSGPAPPASAGCPTWGTGVLGTPLGTPSGVPGLYPQPLMELWVQLGDAGIWTDFPGWSRTSCLLEAVPPKKLRPVRQTGHFVLFPSPINEMARNADLLPAPLSEANEEPA